MSRQSIICIKNGKLFLPDRISAGTIWIKEGRINKISLSNQIAQDYKSSGDVVCIDAKGKYVLPGMIDPHVHFRTPGAEYKEDWFSGSRAALSGGVTTVLDMPNTNPSTVSLKDLEIKRKLAEGNSLVNFGFYLGLTKTNIQLISAESKNTAGIKIFMGSSTGSLLLDDDNIIEEFLKNYKGLAVFHAEDEKRIQQRQKLLADEMFNINTHSKIRDEKVALIATKKIISWAKKFLSVHFHIAHVSTAEEMDLVSGVSLSNLTMEVAPHHLFFSTEDYNKMGSRVQMNPPVRNKENLKAIVKYIKEGRVAFIASDHAPHLLKEKKRAYPGSPSGVPGVDISFTLLYNYFLRNKIDLEILAKMTSENAAEVFSIKNRGKLKEGYFADIMIFNPKTKWTYAKSNCFSKCAWSPYENLKFRGQVESVFVNGVLTYDVFKFSKFTKNPNGKELVFEN